MTGSSLAIEFEQVSKRYRIGSATGSLRDAVASVAHRLRSRRLLEAEREHWALRQVSFNVSRGEAVGLIGRNGAGKTTTLKLLSRITKPTAGRLSLTGRVAALIELGAGFHPDLTGRQNLYLNGAILGLSRRQIDARFDQIVDFAELWPFIDTPVKRYSSGMYARLGFAVAAHTDPDILLVDEVLAVGDINFQQRCLNFLHGFVNSGRTTVFVSHNLYAAEQLCQRLIWLHQGQVKEIGESSTVIKNYLEYMEDAAAKEVETTPKSAGDALQINSVRVVGNDGLDRAVFKSGEDIVVHVDYAAREQIRRPHFCIWVSDGMAPEPLFAANMIIDGQSPESIESQGAIRCVFRAPPLLPKLYYVWLEVYGEDRASVLFRWQRLAAFRVFDPDLLGGDAAKGSIRFVKAHGSIRIPYEWQCMAAMQTTL